MRLLLLFAFIASVSAFAEIEKDYHEAIGIPLAAKIKAYEDELSRNPKTRSRIVNGVTAPPGGQPYFGGLLVYFFSGETSVCGSSLLSPTRAITAAHCWSYGPRHGRMLTVILDSTQLYSNSGIRVNSNHVVLHPLWNQSNLNNDVAIIYLPSRVPLSGRIQPISIPSATEIHESFVGHRALATGFGKTRDCKYIFEVMSNVECARIFTQVGTIVPSTLCTSGFGGVGICGGDSGGPLVAKYNGRQVLIGVSSFSAQNACERGFPSGFARVTSFRNFILQHLN